MLIFSFQYRRLLQTSDKGQIFYLSSQTALGSRGCLFFLFDCHHAQKPENCLPKLTQYHYQYHYRPLLIQYQQV